MKKVHTVLGDISPDKMGFTLPHEHIFWDLRYYLPKENVCNDPVSLENVGEMKFDRMRYSENLYQQDIDIAVKEVSYFKQAGGATICDNGCYGLCCDPLKLKDVSKQTGVNIIKGTGGYVSVSLPEEIKSMDVDKMAELFIKEIKCGIDDTSIRAGFIGEIGIESGVPEQSVKMLTAAAIAQKETGASILIHQPGWQHKADTMFKIITDNGGDLNRTVMCHCDAHIPDADYIDYMAKSGTYISFDFFGLEIPLGNKPGTTNDNDRVFAILDQIGKGNLNKLLISHDTAYKFQLRQYGGLGYAHIPKRATVYMIDAGYKKEWIDTITVENPKEVFSIEE